jgi:hypothetical protein
LCKNSPASLSQRWIALLRGMLNLEFFCDIKKSMITSQMLLDNFYLL